MEKRNGRKERKTELTCFLEKLQLSNLEEKQFMPLKLFEFLEQFIMKSFLIKLTQFEKTGSICKILISLGNLIIKFLSPNQKSITFFVNFTFLLFDSGVCLFFEKKSAFLLKRNQKSNQEKLKLSVNKLRLFPEKKTNKNHHSLHKKTRYVHYS